LDTSSLDLVERLLGWKGRFFHTAGPRALTQLSIASASINPLYKEGRRD
jgi:hypothetical protein